MNNVYFSPANSRCVLYVFQVLKWSSYIVLSVYVLTERWPLFIFVFGVQMATVGHSWDNLSSVLSIVYSYFAQATDATYCWRISLLYLHDKSSCFSSRNNTEGRGHVEPLKTHRAKPRYIWGCPPPKTDTHFKLI